MAHRFSFQEKTPPPLPRRLKVFQQTGGRLKCHRCNQEVFVHLINNHREIILRCCGCLSVVIIDKKCQWELV